MHSDYFLVPVPPPLQPCVMAYGEKSKSFEYGHAHTFKCLDQHAHDDCDPTLSDNHHGCDMLGSEVIRSLALI